MRPGIYSHYGLKWEIEEVEMTIRLLDWAYDLSCGMRVPTGFVFLYLFTLVWMLVLPALLVADAIVVVARSLATSYRFREVRKFNRSSR